MGRALVNRALAITVILVDRADVHRNKAMTGWEFSSVVKGKHSVHQASGSIPSTIKNKIRQQEQRQRRSSHS